ncbi:hypothetical protein OAE61_01795 [Verrucomicrobiales bacterium]|nr:hypothetical protein [Verrucomicrobiales bacterium]MDC0321967.1 hypothetical protein [Verrucomicrobiales bacterium]
MATKTISVNLEAYERLTNARTAERESFSQVICRAEWAPKSGTSLDLLSRVENSNSTADIAFLDEAQDADSPPKDIWDSEHDD